MAGEGTDPRSAVKGVEGCCRESQSQKDSVRFELLLLLLLLLGCLSLPGAAAWFLVQNPLVPESLVCAPRKPAVGDSLGLFCCAVAVLVVVFAGTVVFAAAAAVVLASLQIAPLACVHHPILSAPPILFFSSL